MSTNVESLMKRGRLFLEDEDWKQADEYFDRVLDTDPEYAPAYVGRLCAELNLRQEEMLAKNDKLLDEYGHFKKAMRFADAEYRVILENYNEEIKQRVEEREKEIKERIREERKRIAKFRGCISAGGIHTVGLKTNGKIVAVGDNKEGQCNASGWGDVVSVFAGGLHSVGLKTDGTVVAVGDNTKDQCNVSDWQDIVSVSVGNVHTVGLKSDGTVVAVGDNEKVQCNVSDWRDIISVFAGRGCTAGLKSDGTVVVVGHDEKGQCNVSDWRDIISVSVGWNHTWIREIIAARSLYGGIISDSVDWNHTVGLKSNGTVVAVGNNEKGQCNVSDWQEVVSISAGGSHTIGLKLDGTVVAIGDNEKGQCNVSEWRDVVAIAAGPLYTVGLKAEGTVVVAGINAFGQLNVGDWQDIGPISEEKRLQQAQNEQRLREERERVAKFKGCILADGDNTFGLKTDGTVYAIGHKKYYDHIDDAKTKRRTNIEKCTLL